MKKLPIFLIGLLALILGLASCENTVLPPVIIEPVGEDWLVLKSTERPKKICEGDTLLYLGLRPSPKNQGDIWWWYKLDKDCQIAYISPYKSIEEQCAANTKVAYLIIDTLKAIPPEMESGIHPWTSLAMRIKWLPEAYSTPGKNIYYTNRVNTVRYDPKTFWVVNTQQTKPVKFINYQTQKIILGTTNWPPREHSSPTVPVFLILAFVVPLVLNTKIKYLALAIWVIWTGFLLGYHLGAIAYEGFGEVALSALMGISITGACLLSFGLYTGIYRSLKRLSGQDGNQLGKKYLNRVITLIIINTIIFTVITWDLTFCWLPAVLGGLSFAGDRLVDRIVLERGY